MSDLIKPQGGVMVFYLLVILIPQFLYFEISFWARGKNYSPKMTESLLVGLLVSLVVVGYWLLGRTLFRHKFSDYLEPRDFFAI
jgi:hypothetical protein